MEDFFINFLNSLGHSLGTWLAIIVGGFGLIGGILTSIKKVKQKYDKSIQNKVTKQEKEKELYKSINNVADSISSIQSNLNTMSTQYKTQFNDLNTKLDDVWTAVIDAQKDSREGDMVLENHLKTNEQTLDNMGEKIHVMDEKTTLLIESDKEGIKSYIVDKYYQAQKDDYIEMHSMDTLEQRYAKYLQENGDTYIENLMKELRNMPKEKPKQ